METDFDKDQESSCINYLDANDLYGVSMKQNYHIETQNGMIKLTEPNKINYINGNTGYILELYFISRGAT